MSRPSVLFVTCHLPYPPLSGGRRRELELIRRVCDQFDVTLCAVSKTYSEDLENAPALAEHCSHVWVFPAEPASDPRSPEPAQVTRHMSRAMTARVEAAVRDGRFDLLHVEGFYLMQHVPRRNPLPVLLVEQNVEYVLWRQRAATALSKLEREGSINEYLRTLEAETAAWRQADLCAALTEDDAEIMRSAAPGVEVRLVPDGVDDLAAAAPPAASVATPPAVVFAANFAYQPNVDAALYLCQEIWPRVERRVPDAALLIVGNDPPPEIRRLGSRRHVVVTGRVPAIEPFLDRASVVVCPLRVGGGIKVKMLEAMSRGKAIVTTGVGAQGLRAFSGRAFRVEDHPSGFAHAVVSLLSDEASRRALEEGARDAAETLPTWDEAASALTDCYGELLRRQEGAGPLSGAAGRAR
ncbi:MAG: glycosyltransferase family 4 protein [Actinomycetota bacterium]|nr:glycosyltransferase family 4 protein [Actinomycetota bacterium]